MPRAFVTGASGLVGRALVRELVAQGWEVTGLARTGQAAGLVEAAGGTPRWGDMARPADWEEPALAADVVFHLAEPRPSPPVRGRALRAATRQAGQWAAALAGARARRPLVLASCALAGAGGDPLPLARPARAAERSAAGPGVRVVRLPWVYGPSGTLHAVARALRERRFRLVGPADNRWALVSHLDAARALVAAAGAPDGVYDAAEDDRPAQAEVVAALCRELRAPRPDHLPSRMAGLVLGAPFAETAGGDVVVPGTPPPGFAPRDDWRRDMAERVIPGGG